MADAMYEAFTHQIDNQARRRSAFLTSLIEDDGAVLRSSLISKTGMGLGSGNSDARKSVASNNQTDEMNEHLYAKRDPEEEFFMLSVLAIKLNHTEIYEDTEHIYR